MSHQSSSPMVASLMWSSGMASLAGLNNAMMGETSSWDTIFLVQLIQPGMKRVNGIGQVCILKVHWLFLPGRRAGRAGEKMEDHGAAPEHSAQATADVVGIN